MKRSLLAASCAAFLVGTPAYAIDLGVGADANVGVSTPNVGVSTHGNSSVRGNTSADTSRNVRIDETGREEVRTHGSTSHRNKVEVDEMGAVNGATKDIRAGARANTRANVRTDGANANVRNSLGGAVSAH